MASDTGCLGAVEDNLSAAEVARGKFSEHVIELGPVFGGVGIERIDESVGEPANFGAVFRQSRFECIGPESCSRRRRHERLQQFLPDLVLDRLCEWLKYTLDFHGTNLCERVCQFEQVG